MKREDLERTLETEPEELREALLHAYDAATGEYRPSPAQAMGTLTRLGIEVARGASPVAALITEGIAALFSLGREAARRREREIARGRAVGTAAGLAAWAASKAARPRSSPTPPQCEGSGGTTRCSK